MIRLFILFVLLLSVQKLNSQTVDPLISEDFLNQEKWVDSIYNKLSLDEKIGQLFFVQATAKNKNNSDKILNDIKNFKIGGLIFSTGHPSIQVNLTNKYQNVSDIPLMISMDAEWGVGMRLDSVPKFPWNMSLGAINNDLLVEKIGSEILKICEHL